MFDKIRGNILNNNIRNGILFAVFSIINSGLNFFLLFILAKNLTIADYGYLNLYNNFITIGMCYKHTTIFIITISCQYT